MTTFLNERNRIVELLDGDINKINLQEIRLLTKHFKEKGLKKCKTKEEIKKMYEEYCPIYNKYVDYKKVNKIVEKTWKETVPIKEITEVQISKSAVDWFLSLENKKLTDEEVEYLISRNKFKTKKSAKVWDFNTAKFMFTLYIWALIQKNYMKNPWMVSIERCSRQFKKCANLSNNISYQKIQNCLHDLGYIYITSRRFISVNFRENFDEEGEMIILSGDDLINCGAWLTKQRNGSFVCACCGKELPKYSNKGSARKYCKECSEIVNNNKATMITKICIDCGKEFKCSSRSHKTVRCRDCQDKKNKEVKNQYRKKNEKRTMT